VIDEKITIVYGSRPASRSQYSHNKVLERSKKSIQRKQGLKVDKRDSIATMNPYHVVREMENRDLIWNVRPNQSRDSRKREAADTPYFLLSASWKFGCSLVDDVFAGPA
jgi:hypothetical protein